MLPLPSRRPHWLSRTRHPQNGGKRGSAAIWEAFLSYRVFYPVSSSNRHMCDILIGFHHVLAIWGAFLSYWVFYHVSSKRLFKLPHSRNCHRFEDGRYPRVLIFGPKKDLSPRCKKEDKSKGAFAPPMSWHLHQPESRQLSLKNICDRHRPRHQRLDARFPWAR